MYILCLVLLALLGLCAGSFCNVLIFRIPRKEEFVRTPSHCMACGRKLRWYELVPVISWLCQGGKCRSCGARLSPQYPIVEGLNGILWLLAGLLFPGDWLHITLYCALASLLIVLSVIDWRTFEIPNGINLAIFILGAVHLAADLSNWASCIIGFFAVSLVFLLLWFFTGGGGIGLGDVKLVAAAGLLLGWQKMILAVLAGSLAGVVIHSIRMKHGAGRKLAFGPYLAAGILLAALFGGQIISAYLGLFGL